MKNTFVFKNKIKNHIEANNNNDNENKNENLEKKNYIKEDFKSLNHNFPKRMSVDFNMNLEFKLKLEKNLSKLGTSTQVKIYEEKEEKNYKDPEKDINKVKDLNNKEKDKGENNYNKLTSEQITLNPDNLLNRKISEKEEKNEMSFSDYLSSDDDCSDDFSHFSNRKSFKEKEDKIYKIAEVSNLEENESIIVNQVNDYNNDNLYDIEQKSSSILNMLKEKNEELDRNLLYKKFLVNEFEINENNNNKDNNSFSISSLQDKEGEDLIEKYKKKAQIMPCLSDKTKK